MVFQKKSGFGKQNLLNRIVALEIGGKELKMEKATGFSVNIHIVYEFSRRANHQLSLEGLQPAAI